MRTAPAVLFLLLTVRTFANDTAATLGAGGLIPIKSSSISMESEDLTILAGRITVKYVFRNTSNRDVDTLIGFPLPEINGAAVANIPIRIPSTDPGNYIDFRVLAGGKLAEPHSELRAFFERREITHDLQSLAIPLSVLDPGVTRAVQRLTPAVRAKLEKSNWVDCALTSDGKCWPYWRTRIQFYWTQHFPAGQTVAIEHTYRPIVGGAQLYASTSLQEPLKPYCGDPATVKPRVPRDPDSPVWSERRIQYILTTANNWNGPIRNFHLTVETASSEDLFFTCLSGFTRTGATHYELRRSQFRPAGDLDLLILEPR